MTIEQIKKRGAGLALLDEADYGCSQLKNLIKTAKERFDAEVFEPLRTSFEGETKKSLDRVVAALNAFKDL